MYTQLRFTYIVPWEALLSKVPTGYYTVKSPAQTYPVEYTYCPVEYAVATCLPTEKKFLGVLQPQEYPGCLSQLPERAGVDTYKLSKCRRLAIRSTGSAEWLSCHDTSLLDHACSSEIIIFSGFALVCVFPINPSVAWT